MKLSIQTGDIVDRLGLEKGYKAIKDIGFDAVDWNLDHAWKSADLRSGDYRGKCIFEKPLEDVIKHYEYELNIIKSNGLEITQAHAPFPACMDNIEETLDYAIEVYKRNIEYCSYAGCKNLVIHGISYRLGDKFSKDEIDRKNRKLYSSLIPTLLENNVTVCLENLFSSQRGVCYQGHCSYPEEAKKEIDELNALAGKEVFGFCLDTGHANLLHHDIRSFILTLGKRIKCLHIHDNNGQNDQHLAPLTGTLDWENFCTAMNEIGYDNDLSFETFAQTNLVMNFDEDMLYPWMKLIQSTGECFRRRIEK
ncbi:MAG: sugar phosphate isomerase/epimerase [Clostridia bacterium]|nr:sugar phosphate isomerase/epimerase [Clostridia bacterium]